MGRTGRSLEIARAMSSRHMLRVARELGLVGKRRRRPTDEGAAYLRTTLEELGTTFVKLGQLLSSRPDIVGELYAEHLAGLQDDLAPIPWPELEAIVERAFGYPVDDVFEQFDEAPLATASIAQTHTAVLRETGDRVVVKIRRPGIDELVEQDLDILAGLARRAEDRVERAGLLKARTIVDELRYSLRRELDMRADAANAMLIHDALERFERIRVPRIHTDYVTESVLVMERIDGVRIDEPGFVRDLDRESAAELAHTFLRAFVEQILVHGVYHADPHPGNVLFLPEQQAIALLDYGLIGKIDDSTRLEFGLLLLAMAENRAEDMADLLLRMSTTDRSSDEQTFHAELRRLLPRYRHAALGDIRVGEGIIEVQALALRCNVGLPIPFALLGKTLSQVDTIARALDPEVDPLGVLRTATADILREQAQKLVSLPTMVSMVGTPALSLMRLPRRAEHVLERLERGQLTVGVAPTQLDEAVGEVRTIANRLAYAVITAAMVIASALLMNVRGVGEVLGYPALGFVGFVVAFALGLLLVVRMLRTEGGL